MDKQFPSFRFVLLCVIAIFCAAKSNGQALLAQVDTTTFAWQSLPQPPVPVTSFARQGDRLFAGTNYGLFFSDDLGANWQQHPDFLTKIEKVTADELGVMVERYVLGLQSPPYSYSAWYYIHRSGDGGNNFDPPILVNAGGFHSQFKINKP